MIDLEKLFTFKQRAEELTKALKRHYTDMRQKELDDITDLLKTIENKLKPKG